MNDTPTRALVPKPQVSAGGAIAPIVPQNLDEAWRLSEAFHASGMAPNKIDSPAKVMVVICGGAEVGFGPFQSLQSFAVINGRLSMWGDAIPALLWAHGFSLAETFDNEGPDFPGNMTAICKVIRPDGQEIVRSFSVADAKRASLWGKQGPWVQYPRRMLQMRARAFAARDGAPDVLRGIAVGEDVEDIAAEVTVASNKPQALSVDRIEPEEPTHEDADIDEILDGDDLPDENEAEYMAKEAEEGPESPDVPADDAEALDEPESAPETDDGEDFPPDMRKFIDKVEDSTTFGEVKGALQEFFTTSTFRSMNLNQQNHIRRQTWDTIADKKAEGHMIDLPDHAQDVSAFRLWVEAQKDPDAITGTFDVLKRTPNYEAKDDTFKSGFAAAVENRIRVLVGA